MSTVWSEKEDQLLKKHRPSKFIGEIYSEFIKAGFTRSIKAIERRADRLGIRFIERDDGKDKEKMLADAWIRIQELGKSFTTEHGGISTGLVEKPTTKILSISDMHIPFQNDELILNIVHEHSDADILVINGDLFDLYACSSFGQRMRVPMLKEYGVALEWLRIFAGVFKKIYLVDGNHERRLNWKLSKEIEQEVTALLARPVMERLANGETYDDTGKLIGYAPFKNVFYTRDSAWFLQLGKTIFAHPDKYLGPTITGTLRTAVSSNRYFRGKRSYDCIVMAHSHHFGSAVDDSVLIIEQGATCNLLEYEHSDSKMRWGNQVSGYAIIYQDKDGNTDFGRSHPIFCGIQYEQKEPEL